MESLHSRKYWIIVASKDHVSIGLKDGFTQANHGKAAPLKRMQPGDYIIWYSGKDSLSSEVKCQKFTGIARVEDSEVFQVEISPSFKPYRRRVEVLQFREISILPLIENLHFIPNKKSWGYPFRWGFLQIEEHDFLLIAKEMIVDQNLLSTLTS
jgi:predicted RNA-binding protein